MAVFVTEKKTQNDAVLSIVCFSLAMKQETSVAIYIPSPAQRRVTGIQSTTGRHHHALYPGRLPRGVLLGLEEAKWGNGSIAD